MNPTKSKLPLSVRIIFTAVIISNIIVTYAVVTGLI